MKENLRKYGQSPYSVVLVHGGPGAPGEMAPVARELSKRFGVLEPFQTADSIKGQIEELKEIIEKEATIPVTLVGWSWGAWLAFLLAAKYPNLVKRLILVSSGPFEESYAKEIMPTRMSHLSEQNKSRVEELMKMLQNPDFDNKDAIFSEFGILISKADSLNAIPHDEDVIEVQSQIYERVWPEAAELRKNGKLIGEGKKIVCPVVAIHGDYDPHPVEGVKKPLSEVINDFRFVLLKNCGHHPWYEKEAREGFFRILNQELE